MQHLWIAFGLLSAFSLATNNALLKKMFVKHNEYVVTWLTYFVTTTLLLAMLPLISIPRIGTEAQRAHRGALRIHSVQRVGNWGTLSGCRRDARGLCVACLCDLRNSTNRSLLLSNVPGDHEQPLFLGLWRRQAAIREAPA